MLAKRIIPCLDVTGGRVVKGVNFVELRDAGDPVEIAARYNEQGADELTFLDITATSDGRDLILHIIEAVAAEVFIPLTVGGGVRDEDWLRAVEQHHERPDGNGYPLGRSDIDEKARLLRLADSYCAKLSPRATRPALTPDRAGRELFLREATNPMAHALIKELGIYPPGSYVRLASGETGVVLRRGPTMLTPVVAAVTWRTGEPRREPLKRDTSLPAFKVLQSVAAQALRVAPTTESLLAAA